MSAYDIKKLSLALFLKQLLPDLISKLKMYIIITLNSRANKRCPRNQKYLKPLQEFHEGSEASPVLYDIAMKERMTVL